MGRPVMSYEKRLDAFWEKVNKTELCWEWTGQLNQFGYGLFYDGKKVVRAHRFSFQIQNRLGSLDMVLHGCNNRKCVNPSHLRIGTHKDNFNDSLKAGTAAVCQNNSQAKLTKEQVLKIKEMYIPWKFGCLKLARIFNVSRRNITRIVSGEAWRYVNYV